MLSAPYRLHHPIPRRRRLPVRSRRHVAVHQRVHEKRGLRQRKLLLQHLAQPPLLRLQQSERVIGDQPAQPLIGPMLIAQEPRSVQRVEPSRRHTRRIADVMQDGSRAKQARILAHHACERGGPSRDTLRVHPPPRQRGGKLGLCKPRGPLDHVIVHTWGHSLHYAALLLVGVAERSRCGLPTPRALRDASTKRTKGRCQCPVQGCGA
jgi:hypothetical protein